MTCRQLVVEYLDFYDAFMKVEKPTNNSRGRSRGMESKITNYDSLFTRIISNEFSQNVEQTKKKTSAREERI
jgi:hypothetical protein